MAKINILDQDTINKIAAGEVVERPSSVVKELVENAIDAGATAVSVAITAGGTSQIRVVDNGSGFDRDDIAIAFQKNTTSKIKTADDLVTVTSFGFRGEALSSIAAVSKLELITKSRNDLTGIRYEIHGGIKQKEEEVGCPNGTTFLVNDLFYNTPVRRKFLKSSMTEAGYVNEVMERIALSHTDVAIKFTNNNKLIINTSGNSKLEEVIYGIYGRDIAGQLLQVNDSAGSMSIQGMIAKPMIARGNRNFENYFLNGRYIRNSLISKAIEDAYRGYLMQNKYPFTALSLEILPQMFDVNVHPAKLEVRFTQPELIYEFVYQSVRSTIVTKESIPETKLIHETPPSIKSIPTHAPEPFESVRIAASDSIYRPPVKNEHRDKDSTSQLNEQEPEYRVLQKSLTNETNALEPNPISNLKEPQTEIIKKVEPTTQQADTSAHSPQDDTPVADSTNDHATLNQLSFLSTKQVKPYRIIGQVFSTYWMVEYDDKLYIIDQHAAHERILYDKLMAMYTQKEPTSQQLFPSLILSLSLSEQESLERAMPYLKRLGYDIEPFGGKEFKVSAVPAELTAIGKKELLIEVLDGLTDGVMSLETDAIYEKIASMSCKAAVKGNQQLSFLEAEALIKELMNRENPFHCPHGRPITIELSRYELEKKFKRIL